MEGKLDLKKYYKELFNVKEGEFKKVHCPVMYYIASEGCGDPNTNPQYQEIIESLYKVAYSLKFKAKKDNKDFVVMPPCGLWWADNMEHYLEEKKENWKWIMMIQIPDYISENEIEEIKMEKGINNVFYRKYYEGDAVETLYVGPYSDEGETVAKIHKTIKENGGVLRGCHQEIYLSDPRKTAPEKLKTIIRQPAFFQTDNKVEFLEGKRRFLEQIGEKKTMVLATSADEEVAARNMSCIVIGGKIYFQSDKKFKKATDIRKNKNIALCVDNMQITGKVVEVGDINSEKVIEFKNKYSKLNESSYRAYSHLIDTIVYEVEVLKVVLWKYEKDDVYREFLDFERQVAWREWYLKS